MAEVLSVEQRTADGSRVAKRLRRAGEVPAILYGHGEKNLPLAIKSEQISAAVRHGVRVVDLQGAANEKAFIRALQWDVYGIEILHVDLTRVSEHERIQVEVKVGLRGEAPGIKDGGVVEHLVHEVEIDCEALAIPEKLFVSINELKVGDSLTAAAIQLPAGVTLITDVNEVIVHCIVPVEVDESTAEAGAAEPEVIGRKPDEESEDE